MKVAIITPTAELETLTHPNSDDIHLVLPHLLSDERYKSFYRARSHEGDWVILDNSAYETAAGDPAQLLLDAVSINADEIVVPDKLNDCEATLALAGRAFECWTTAKHVRLLKPQLMLVPQGRTLDEWRTCLFGLVLRWRRFVRGNPELQQRDIGTIGLAVPATRRVGISTETLLEQWLIGLHHDYGFEIHLLGVRSLYQLNRLAQEFPWVRSTDTAKPIVYAMHGLMLDPLYLPEAVYPGRPTDYFSRELDDQQRKVARYNNAVTAQLARGQFKKVVGA